MHIADTELLSLCSIKIIVNACLLMPPLIFSLAVLYNNHACNSVEIKKFKLESIIEIQYNHVCKLTVDIITADIAITVEVYPACC